MLRKIGLLIIAVLFVMTGFTQGASVSLAQNDDGEAGQSTLRIEPAAVTLEVGEYIWLKAFYDPDGSGPEPEQDVTQTSGGFMNGTLWSAEDRLVLYVYNLPGGIVKGLKDGSTIVHVKYKGLIAYAEIRVGEGTTDDEIIDGDEDIDDGEIIDDVDLLNLSKDELYEYLIDGSVADVWWDLPRIEREELALKIIDWWSVPMGYISKIGLGESDCRGGIYQEDTAVCRHNAAIRACLFGDSSFCPKDFYYYFDGEWRCWYTEDSFRLPIYGANVNLPPGYYVGATGHAMAAIQIGEDVSDLDDWIIFQYSKPDIQVGDWQIPYGSYDLWIGEIYDVDYIHGLQTSKTIYKWDLRETQPIIRIEPTNVTIEVGETQRFRAYYDPDGSWPKPERDVTDFAFWSSSDSSTVELVDGAKFKGVSQGVAVITTSYKGIITETKLGVGLESIQPTLRIETLDVTTDVTTIEVGECVFLRAYYDSDGSNGPEPEVNVACKNLCCWSSSNNSIIGFDWKECLCIFAAVFRGMEKGQATIQAEYKGLIADVKIEVV